MVIISNHITCALYTYCELYVYKSTTLDTIHVKASPRLQALFSFYEWEPEDEVIEGTEKYKTGPECKPLVS